MTEHTQQVMAALRKAPGFEDVGVADSVTWLGGLTNLVHRVDLEEKSVIVRIPGQGTEAYIDRAVEAHNAHAAARAEVSPEVVYAEPDSGLMITQAVPNIETMTPDLFNRRAGARAREAAQFGRSISNPVRTYRHDRRLSEGAVHERRSPSRWVS